LARWAKESRTLGGPTTETKVIRAAEKVSAFTCEILAAGTGFTQQARPVSLGSGTEDYSAGAHALPCPARAYGEVFLTTMACHQCRRALDANTVDSPAWARLLFCDA
jgi:hypothetical protein